ncbi:MAG: polysaccharide deacetylase family protein [Pseudomonadota bacterium]
MTSLPDRADRKRRAGERSLGRWLLLIAACLSTSPVFAGSPKILLYHHVSDSTPSATSVTPTVFESHLELLARERFEVVPLAQIVDALLNGEAMDSRWVAITFDDAYGSVLSEAAPRLESRGWPYTVFVSTDYIDGDYGLYLSWEQLRDLERRGATLANHTLSHEHLVRRRPGETDTARLERLAEEVNGAQVRLEAELEDPLRLLAYPYGEFDAEVVHLMQSLGFIAFGQQSGPVGRTTSPYAIPRFPLATGFDSVSSLHEKLRTEHLPLAAPPIPAEVLSADAEAPRLTLNLDEAGIREGALTCFIGGQPNTRVSWIAPDRVEVQGERPLNPGRSKYTCTAPHPSKPRAYFWHTQLYIKPRPDGSWYEG